MVDQIERDGSARSDKTWVLQASDLWKTFGSGSRRATALQGLTLSVPRGGVYGVLGPNGAGKSTLFRVLLGLVTPDKGTIKVMGDRPAANPRQMRKIGSMIETPSFPPFLSGFRLLQMLSLYSGRRPTSREMLRVLESVGLADAAHRRAATYSVGMKQRLGIASALLIEPELVVLDEPTSGMDPAGVVEIRRLIRTLADDRGVTVLLASHMLNEVESVCDRTAIIVSGRLRAEGRIDELTRGGERLRLNVRPMEPVLALLGARGSEAEGLVYAHVSRAEAPELLRRLVAEEIDIFEASWSASRLEDVFLAQTGAGE